MKSKTTYWFGVVAVWGALALLAPGCGEVNSSPESPPESSGSVATGATLEENASKPQNPGRSDPGSPIPKPEIEFMDWCAQHLLAGCELGEPQEGFDDALWQVLWGTLLQLMNTPSRIQLSSETLQNEAFQRLADQTLGERWRPYFGGLTTVSLAPENGEFLLGAQPYQGNFGGLQLRAAPEVSFRRQEGGLQLQGLSAALGEAGEAFELVDLQASRAFQAHMETSQERVLNFPLAFFSDVSGGGAAPFQVVRAVAELLAMGIPDLQNGVDIHIPEANMNVLRETLLPEIDRNPPAGLVAAHLLALTRELRVNFRADSALLSLSHFRDHSCTLRLSGLPVVGEMDLEVNFSQGVRLSNASVEGGVIRFPVEGVSAQSGFVRTSVDRIEVTESRVEVVVGSLVRIPVLVADDLSTSQEDTGAAARLESVSCDS